MEEKQDNNKNLSSPFGEDLEDEFSEEDERDSSSSSSESEEWPTRPNTAAVEQSGLKLSRTTSKVELFCFKQLLPSTANGMLSGA